MCCLRTCRWLRIFHGPLPRTRDARECPAGEQGPTRTALVRAGRVLRVNVGARLAFIRSPPARPCLPTPARRGPREKTSLHGHAAVIGARLAPAHAGRAMTRRGPCASRSARTRLRKATLGHARAWSYCRLPLLQGCTRPTQDQACHRQPRRTKVIFVYTAGSYSPSAPHAAVPRQPRDGDRGLAQQATFTQPTARASARAKTSAAAPGHAAARRSPASRTRRPLRPPRQGRAALSQAPGTAGRTAVRSIPVRPRFTPAHAGRTLVTALPITLYEVHSRLPARDARP